MIVYKSLTVTSNTQWRTLFKTEGLNFVKLIGRLSNNTFYPTYPTGEGLHAKLHLKEVYQYETLNWKYVSL